MKIALASDLHLEFGDLTLTNSKDADVLILAGDILLSEDLHDHDDIDASYPKNNLTKLSNSQYAAYTYRKFLKNVSDEFPKVIYIAGNHEFYNGKWHAGLNYLYDECSRYPNIHFLEDQSITIDNTIFIGATLWTNCNNHDPLTLHMIQNSLNDFRKIRDDSKGYIKLKPAVTVHRHDRSLDFFKKKLIENSDKTCIVISHHAPSFKSVPERYIKDYINNGAYASDLSQFILDHPQIKLWVHGHTHDKFDYMIGDTQIVCNPRGYVGIEISKNDIYELKYIDV